jgi:uncharacterized damage-inducible protein DinB
MPEQPDQPRTDPDLEASELTVLSQFLDFHRATLVMKCAGLSDADLRQRSVSPSGLSLLGLVRHLTEVEYGWFAECLDGQPEQSFYSTDDDPDGDFDNLNAQPVAEVWQRYQAVVADSRRILQTYSDGGEMARGTRGRPRNVRWVLTHMVEEYARHNGHADLLREVIDGSTGE